MMRVVILTNSRFGMASACLPALLDAPGVTVASVVLARYVPSSRMARLRRTLRKVGRIGLLGAVNGLRIRPWYAGPPTPDLLELAGKRGLAAHVAPETNGPTTQQLFREAQADLGLSLGNGYIRPQVYEIPRLGMINIHWELLPEYQGAAGVIWPIYEGKTETGFTIHQIDRRIDNGPILYRESFPICFQATLADTVRATIAETFVRVGPALARVVADYEQFRTQARPQTGGRSYTTPTFKQFLHMLRQHRRLRAAQPERKE